MKLGIFVQLSYLVIPKKFPRIRWKILGDILIKSIKNGNKRKICLVPLPRQKNLAGVFLMSPDQFQMRPKGFIGIL